jgi:carbonic anhydrase
MTVTDSLLENNAKYAASFNGPLPLPPAKHVAVVACMDARLNVFPRSLIHHTDCGMLTFSDEEFRSGIQRGALTGGRAGSAREQHARVEQTGRIERLLDGDHRGDLGR